MGTHLQLIFNKNKENVKKGRVINRNYYVDKVGNKYKVDGKNVVLD